MDIFGLLGAALVMLNVSAIWHWPNAPAALRPHFVALPPNIDALLHVYLHLTNLGLGILIVGLLFSGTSSIPPRLAALLPSGFIMNVWQYLKAHATQMVETFSQAVLAGRDAGHLLSRVHGLAVWSAAVSQPVATIRRLLSTADPKLRRDEFFALSWSSCAVSMTVVVVAGFCIRVPRAELLTGFAGQFLAILVMMLGGFACHVIFRMFGLPSQLMTTLVLCGVPQALCLPIIAALSLPSISLEHAVLAGMHGQTLSLTESFKDAFTGMRLGVRALNRGVPRGLLAMVSRSPHESVCGWHGGLRCKRPNFLLPVPLHVAVAYWLID